jgi:hypothetical protein
MESSSVVDTKLGGLYEASLSELRNGSESLASLQRVGALPAEPTIRSFNSSLPPEFN